MRLRDTHLPHGFRRGQYVKITSISWTGPKIGITSDPCKYDDGILVWLPGEKGKNGNNGEVYQCVLPGREGDSIKVIPMREQPQPE